MSPAVAAAEPRLVTADEFFLQPDHGMRRELVCGEVREMSPAGTRHGRVVGNVFASLHGYAARAGGLVLESSTGCRLCTDPDTVRVPDVSFIAAERAEAVGDIEGFWPGAPDLAIEVVSPSDSFAEVDEKVAEYLDAGCRMVVVVNPRRRTAAVYRSRKDIVLLTENDALDGDDVVPGWNLPLREIFPRP
jgi:Uma2 family endonuclease